MKKKYLALVLFVFLSMILLQGCQGDELYPAVDMAEGTAVSLKATWAAELNNQITGNVINDAEILAKTMVAGTMQAESEIQQRVQETVNALGNQTQNNPPNITPLPIDYPPDGPGDLYPQIEDFSNTKNFSYTSGAEFSNSGGKLYWNFYRDGGSQFAYRSIPEFDGSVLLTVIGKVTAASNNCSIGVGIGDSIGEGVEIRFGYYGGGCSNSGPVVLASGVNLNTQEVSACQFSSNWPWIKADRYYTVSLLLDGRDGWLTVGGNDSIYGQRNYYGSYDLLWIGEDGDGDWPSCSGAIDKIIVEPVY